MRQERPTQIIWRRKWLVLVTFLVVTAGTAIISKSLPKEYATTSTLIVAQPEAQQAFDSVQAAQAVARSYANIVGSTNFAERVATELGEPGRVDELVASTSAEIVPETQLLQITAEDDTAAGAKRIADTYARVFIESSRGTLAQTTRAEVSLADAAPLRTAPAKPKPTLYTMLGALLGLGLGVALAFLSSLMNRRVRSPEELGELLEIPVLARIVFARGERARRLNDEAYRVLRTNLDFVRPGKALRSLTVVSPSEGDGKTSTVVSLARANSEVGDRVIVVEGDMRKPAAQRALLPESTEPLGPGLSNYLAGAATLDEVVHPTDNDLLWLVPAGPRPPVPSALLDTDRGRRLMLDLAERADLVIVDTPPLAVGADASLFAAASDDCLLVVDTRRSTIKAISAAIQQLRLIKADVSGVLVNRVRQSSDELATYGYYAPPERPKRRRGRRGGNGAKAAVDGEQPAQAEDAPRPVAKP